MPIEPSTAEQADALAAEQGHDASKRIHQRHFEEAMRDVLGAKNVMQQSLYSDIQRGEEKSLTDVLKTIEHRWRRIAAFALGVAAIALLAALAALLIALR